MSNKVKVTVILQSDEDPSEVMDWFEHVLTYDIGSFELDPAAVEHGEAITVEDIDGTKEYNTTAYVVEEHVWRNQWKPIHVFLDKSEAKGNCDYMNRRDNAQRDNYRIAEVELG